MKDVGAEESEVKISDWAEKLPKPNDFMDFEEAMKTAGFEKINKSFQEDEFSPENEYIEEEPDEGEVDDEDW